jgi:hypothetical protein
MEDDSRKLRQLSPTDRLQRLIERQSGECVWCRFDLARSQARPTRDHLVPKVKGGPNRYENEVAACASCNAQRGHIAPSAFAQSSRVSRGCDPQIDILVEQLDLLTRAIEREGGMRKIRDYVARERKRLEQMLGSS